MRDAQAIVPENKLQVSVLHCHPSILWSGKARYGLGRRLLHDLGIKGWVYSPCKRTSKLGQAGTDVLLEGRT